MSKVEEIRVGDTFMDMDTDVWEVVDIFKPEWVVESESITLRLQNNPDHLTTFPDHFDGGGFFEWFSPICPYYQGEGKRDIN